MLSGQQQTYTPRCFPVIKAGAFRFPLTKAWGRNLPGDAALGRMNPRTFELPPPLDRGLEDGRNEQW